MTSLHMLKYHQGTYVQQNIGLDKKNGLTNWELRMI